jgi:hypothetical protein
MPNICRREIYFVLFSIATGMKIYVEVTLGSPAAECARFGICSVEVLPPDAWHAFVPRHMRHIKAILTAEGDGVSLYCPFDGMRFAARAQFFPPEGFRVDAAKALSPAIAGMLGAAPGRTIVIQPGLYPVTVSADAITIKITGGGSGVSARAFTEKKAV